MPDCSLLTNKKYRNRPGPPYPANYCQNQIKVGNDGREYESSPNKNGVYSWKVIKDDKKQISKKQISKKQESKKQESKKQESKKQSKTSISLVHEIKQYLDHGFYKGASIDLEFIKDINQILHNIIKKILNEISSKVIDIDDLDQAISTSFPNGRLSEELKRDAINQVKRFTKEIVAPPETLSENKKYYEYRQYYELDNIEKIVQTYCHNCKSIDKLALIYLTGAINHLIDALIGVIEYLPDSDRDDQFTSKLLWSAIKHNIPLNHLVSESSNSIKKQKQNYDQKYRTSTLKLKQKNITQGDIRIFDSDNSTRHPRTIVEQKLMALSTSIRQKKDWQKKIKDKKIVAKWKVEAEQQIRKKYYSPEMFKYVIDELKYYSTLTDGDIEISAAEGVWQSRSLVSPSVKKTFEEGVKILEKGKPDWHPGSDKQVRDLVHPSLYPLVKGVSKDFYGNIVPFYGREKPADSDEFISTKYQWLPTDFMVSQDGKVEIVSYINNLNPKLKSMYNSIATIFKRFIPLFNNVITELVNPLPNRIKVNAYDWYDAGDMYSEAMKVCKTNNNLGNQEETYIKLRTYIDDFFAKYPAKKELSESFFEELNEYILEFDGDIDFLELEIEEMKTMKTMKTINNKIFYYDNDKKIEKYMADYFDKNSEKPFDKKFITDTIKYVKKYKKGSGDGDVNYAKIRIIGKLNEIPFTTKDLKVNIHKSIDYELEEVKKKCDEDEIYDYLDSIEPNQPIAPEFIKPSKPNNIIDIRGRKLQVIVKLANLELTPEKPKYEGGVWHIEGMANESIIASGIYYYSVENITESRLSFRQAVHEHIEYEQSDETGVREIYGLSDNGMNTSNSLGSIIAEEDLCIVFSNRHQHRVSPFELENKKKKGHRKILVFFLIDPNQEIISTIDIPPQQKDQGGSMSRSDAEKHRALLMDERKYYTKLDTEELYERPISLCEH